MVLLGPSGSGKSTLIAFAAGPLDVQQGSLHVAGVELWAWLRRRAMPGRA
ncbi:MAG: ATP-binding cassette domain-containing protein [Burkholderiales bacterium]